MKGMIPNDINSGRGYAALAVDARARWSSTVADNKTCLTPPEVTISVSLKAC
jgi:hypothetical protein